MNVTVDSERVDGRMMQMLFEHADDEVTQANVWGLQGFDLKTVGRNIQAKPVGGKRGHLWVDNLQLGIGLDTRR